MLSPSYITKVSLSYQIILSHQAVLIRSLYDISLSCPHPIVSHDSVTPSAVHPVTLSHLIKSFCHIISSHQAVPILSDHPIPSNWPHPMKLFNRTKLCPSYHIIPYNRAVNILSHHPISSSCQHPITSYYPITLSHLIKLSPLYYHPILSSCQHAITSSHLIKLLLNDTVLHFNTLANLPCKWYIYNGLQSTF